MIEEIINKEISVPIRVTNKHIEKKSDSLFNKILNKVKKDTSLEDSNNKLKTNNEHKLKNLKKENSIQLTIPEEIINILKKIGFSEDNIKSLKNSLKNNKNPLPKSEIIIEEIEKMVKSSTLKITIEDLKNIKKLLVEKQTNLIENKQQNIEITNDLKVKKKSNKDISDLKRKKNIITKKDTLIYQKINIDNNVKVNITKKQLEVDVLKIKRDSTTKENIKKIANKLELKPTKIDLINVKTHTQINYIDSVLEKNKPKVEIKPLLSNNIIRKVINENILRKKEKILNTEQLLEIENKDQNTKELQELKSIDLKLDNIDELKGKIIMSQQKVNTFMSDLAKKMYQNYKPPYTTLKIKINPNNLGNLSIILRSNKSSELNIIMNIEKLSTLEILKENKNILQTQIQRQFEDRLDNINLKFNDNPSYDSNEHKKKEEKNKQQKTKDKQEVNIIENDITEIKNLKDLEYEYI